MKLKKSKSTHQFFKDSPYSVFDKLLEGCQIIDHEWRYFYVNDAFVKQGRLPKEQLLGRTMMEAYPGIEQIPMFSTLQKCMKDRTHQKMENEFTFPDGSKSWFDLRFQPVPEGVLIFSVDMTDTKQYKRELDLSREQFELVLEGADLGTWDWNFQSGEVEFNERWAQMLGYTLDEIEPYIRSWEELVHPDDMPGVMEVLEAHLNGKLQTFEAEYRLRHKSGEWIWTLDKGRVLKRDSDGKPLRVCGTHMDITESKLIEEELRESQVFDTSILNKSPTPIFVMEPDSSIKYVNPALERLTGYTAGELLGIKDPHPWGIEGVSRLKIANVKDELADRTFDNTRKELLLQNKEGKRFWVNSSAVLIERGGELKHLLVNWVDITERKRAERKLDIRNKIYQAFLIKSEKDLYAEVLRIVLNALDCEFGVLGYADKEGNLSCPSMTTQVWDQCLMPNRNKVFPKDIWGDSIWGNAFRTGKSGYSNEPSSVPQGHIPINNCLTVPLVIEGKSIGLLTVANKQDGYDDSDKKLLEIIAESISPILQTRLVSERVEEALRDDEAFNRSILASAPNPIIVMEPDSSISYVNPALERLTGYTADELLGIKDPHPWWIRDISEETVTSLRAKLTNSKFGKSATELMLRNKKGELLWVNATSVLIEKEGELKHILVNWVDITDRKRTEETLRESERILNATGKMGKIGGWEHDLTTGKAFWAEALYDIVEIPCDQEPPSIEEHLSYYPPKDRKILEQAYDQAVKNGIPFDVELQVYTVKKKLIWCRAQGEPVYEDGKCVVMRGTFQDITERKLAEEERDKLQSQLSNALEMAHLGPWEFDDANDIFTFNDHFYKIFRTTAKEVGGYRMSSAEYFRRFVHPDDLPVMLEEIQKTLEKTDPPFSGQLEHRMLYADGMEGHINVRFFIVKDDQGKTIKTYGVNQDITERKRMDVELLRSQKLESVGMLAGGIAHDFNNILTAIIGNIAMARMQVGTEDDISDLLSEAEMASTRAKALTRQLLTLAKGGAPVKKTASIKTAIEESSLFMLRGSKTRCGFSIAEDLWPAEVDVGQISQVINNIVINASQAMPEGGIIQVAAENLTIDVGHGLPLNPGRYIRISITDEGVGIGKKHLSKIFDPYFTTKHEGSGLGLAVTYSIIKKHDGHITVESKLGVGTTFNIYLPASEKTMPEKEEVRLIKGQGRILVMDDEASLRKMFDRMLVALGYKPEFAKDGAETIEMYKMAMESGKPYDAVILDLTVPGGMGGREAIEQLLEVDPEVKAIVSSGYSEDPVLSNFQDYGFKGTMPKPFESISLSNTLHEVLRGEG
ncbi:PAS domain S-box protein [Deltaproteobacteria bacterium]|nr:PAS domain S-box protein [Deltaproteobacteria bacterium]